MGQWAATYACLVFCRANHLSMAGSSVERPYKIYWYRAELHPGHWRAFQSKNKEMSNANGDNDGDDKDDRENNDGINDDDDHDDHDHDYECVYAALLSCSSRGCNR